MSDPPRLPPDLIWDAAPLSPACAPNDVFIIALSFYLWWLQEETGWKGWQLGGWAGEIRTGAHIIVTYEESSLPPSAILMAPPAQTPSELLL